VASTLSAEGLGLAPSILTACSTEDLLVSVLLIDVSMGRAIEENKSRGDPVCD
jgi:hypothetical protein